MSVICVARQKGQDEFADANQTRKDGDYSDEEIVPLALAG